MDLGSYGSVRPEPREFSTLILRRRDSMTQPARMPGFAQCLYCSYLFVVPSALLGVPPVQKMAHGNSSADDSIRTCQQNKRAKEPQQGQGQSRGQQEPPKYRQESKALWEHAPDFQVIDGGGLSFSALLLPIEHPTKP
ncbi:hypothetical protein BX616_006206 [Lobosporangium transversale]|nr:hypothetical protein BX616_006206 [Lobosporangium transversale]